MTHFNIKTNYISTKFCLNKKFFHKILLVAVAIVIIFLIFTLVAFPDLFASSFLDGLILFSTAVLPSLFPFMFLTKSLTDLGAVHFVSKILQKPFFAIFRAPAIGCYIFIMSALCGYPVGAKILSDLVTNNCITKQQAEDLLPFCSTSGPLFVVGSVGCAMFSNKALGLAVFGIHILACVLCAFVFGWAKQIFCRKKPSKNLPTFAQKNIDNILATNMMDTCNSILLVGSFISIFYLFIDILTQFKILFPLQSLFASILKICNLPTQFSTGLATGFVEMTRGARDIAASGVTSHVGAILCGTITFSGISILLQSLAFLSKAKISFAKFLGVKTLQTVFAVALAFWLL